MPAGVGTKWPSKGNSLPSSCRLYILAAASLLIPTWLEDDYVGNKAAALLGPKTARHFSEEMMGRNNLPPSAATMLK